jgi:hypothetical protein
VEGGMDEKISKIDNLGKEIGIRRIRTVTERYNCKQEKSQIIFFLLRVQKVNEKNKKQMTNFNIIV